MAGHNARRDVRDLLGVPFRLHGRDPFTGLDCVGVIAWALGEEMVPTGYRLRQGSPDAIVTGLEAAGLVRVLGAQPGDVMVFAVGPAQFHLGVSTTDGIIHACALLQRVVLSPATAWPVIGIWRKGS